MKNKDLIEILKKQPPDNEVVAMMGIELGMHKMCIDPDVFNKWPIIVLDYGLIDFKLLPNVTIITNESPNDTSEWLQQRIKAEKS